MTRQQALERVEKLHRISVRRGATAHEQAAARERAAALIARFGLDRPAATPRPVRPGPSPVRGAYASAARGDRRAPGSLRFVAFG